MPHSNKRFSKQSESINPAKAGLNRTVHSRGTLAPARSKKPSEASGPCGCNRFTKSSDKWGSPPDKKATKAEADKGASAFSPLRRFSRKARLVPSKIGTANRDLSN